jgi:phage/plasmid-like protein (TIGR03299 family)
MNNLTYAIANGRVAGNLGKLLIQNGVGELSSARETIEKSGLGYTCTKLQHTSPLDSKPVDSYGVYRDDNGVFLGQVGSDYTIIQNTQCFDYVDNLLDVEGLHYVGAGSVNKGGEIFIVASLGKFTIKGDEHQAFVIFRDFKNGKGSADVRLSILREACANGMHVQSTLAQSRYRHTKNVNTRMQNVATQSVLRQELANLTGKFDALLERKFTQQEQLTNILNRLFPLPAEDAKRQDSKNLETQGRVLQNFEDNDGNAYPEQRNTAYALYQAISRDIDHTRPMRVTSSRQGQEIEIVRAYDSVFGKGANDKVKILDFILENTVNLKREFGSFQNPAGLLQNILDNRN